MRRLDLLRAVYPELETRVVVTIMGAVSAELQSLGHRPNFFYLLHAMGLASSVGLGIALSRPELPVVVLDGDGSLLMNLGTLTTMARYRPRNLVHVVFDNESLLSVGGFPTATSGRGHPARRPRANRERVPRAIPRVAGGGRAHDARGEGRRERPRELSHRSRDARESVRVSPLSRELGRPKELTCADRFTAKTQRPQGGNSTSHRSAGYHAHPLNGSSSSFASFAFGGDTCEETGLRSVRPFRRCDPVDEEEPVPAPPSLYSVVEIP